MTNCIWCGATDGIPAVEHIIPEALGCPDSFVLSRGEVCKKCNNGMAHLDQAVIDDFDFPSFMAGVPRKNGRPPAVRSRGNVIATKDSDGSRISINMEPYPVEAHDGTELGKFGKSPRNIKASLKHDGPVGRVNFSTPIGQNPKFVRGIVKIAFSSLVYFLGLEVALQKHFDPVRAFVRCGQGVRRILLTANEDTQYRNEVWPPYRSQTGEYAVVVRLAAIEFFVDLSPELLLFPIFKEEAGAMYGKSGWSYLPLDS